MTRLSTSRRVSAFFETLRNFSHNFKMQRQYRSLSTGDLATSRPGYSTDFMEIDFGEPSSLAAAAANIEPHFDDCDKVPVSFGKSGKVKLLPQTSQKARDMMKRGSIESISKAKFEDIHRTQSWFFIDCDLKKAERILTSNGLVENSFLVSYFKNRYWLSVWRKTNIKHYPIYQFNKKNGDVVFQLDIDKTFKNIADLVNHYTKRKGYVLSSKLTKGVSRPPIHPILQAKSSDSLRSRA